MTELYAPVSGAFLGVNPELSEVVDRIHSSPYDQGWLYRVQGPPPDDALDVAGYFELLDATIDRMQGKSG